MQDSDLKAGLDQLPLIHQTPEMVALSGYSVISWALRKVNRGEWTKGHARGELKILLEALTGSRYVDLDLALKTWDRMEAEKEEARRSAS